jgi:hypothetical protein
LRRSAVWTDTAARTEHLSNRRTLMKNLAFWTLLVAAVPLSTGCIISSDDDDDDGGGTVDEDCNGKPFADGACLHLTVECPPDAIGYTLEPFGDELDCVDDADYFTLVDAMPWDLEIVPDSGDPDLTFVSSFQSVDPHALETVDVTFTWPEDGFFGFTWTIDGEMPTTDSCLLGVNGEDVGYVATIAGTDTAFDTPVFPCEDGAGTTDGLPLDDYVVSISVINGDGEAEQTADDVLATLDAEAQFYDLGNVEFETP